MTGIGINLNGLGIESDPDYEVPNTQNAVAYPREYDFTLELALLGSWRQVRGALRGPAESAYKDARRFVPLSLIVLWAERESDTEESIRAALTGMDYDQVVHGAFSQHLDNWAGNQSDPSIIRSAIAATSAAEHRSFIQCLAMNDCTPQDVLQEIMKNSQARHSLLFNPSAGPQMVRELYELIKGEPWAAAIVARATTEVPSEILEHLAKGDYPSIEIPDQLARRNDLTEQALLDLIGKCDWERILAHPNCTQAVRDEIDRVSPSGGALTPEQRARTVKALNKVRTAIMTGRTGSLVSGRSSERCLLESVDAYPGISPGLMALVLECKANVEELARQRQDAWVVAELTALGLPAQGWNE